MRCNYIGQNFKIRSGESYEAKRDGSRWRRLLVRLECLANASQTIRELEFFSLQLEQEFIKIRQGLDITSTGKLSAELLPPQNLSEILQQVALRLPADVSLLARTSLQDMFVYYEVVTVQAYATSSEI
jgi:hypothetical protein